MDNGTNGYRRFLEGDSDGIVEIIKDYKDGLIFSSTVLCRIFIPQKN